MERSRWTLLYVPCLIVLTSLVPRNASDVILENNGYKGVVVVIGDDVGEDANLLERIKQSFTEASNLLFTATKRRAYFKNITMVVPESWSRTSEQSSSSYINPLTEHIRINTPNKARGTAPYVQGTMECGKPGWFMHLTPEFLNITGTTPYGKHANAIVHEWGHLRWGLFDEYPSVDSPGTGTTRKPSKINFYQTDGRWRPVTCSRTVRGNAYLGNCDPFLPCDQYLRGIDLPPSDCKFCPNLNQFGVEGSLMASQWIDNMARFCDADTPSTPGGYRHDSKAPNLQNKVCNGQSAWEVMLQHKDFKNNNNSPMNNTLQPPAPTFTTMKRSPRKRVFVLDVSGSMSGSRIVWLRQAALSVIDDVIETQSWLGIVTFSRTASATVNMTIVDDQTTRTRLKNGIPTSTGGGTNIKAGLQAGVELLEGSFSTAEQTELILISDGKSNIPYDDYFDVLVSKGVTVHSIAISNSADATMTALAIRTGGGSYTYLETNVVSLADVLSEAVTAGQIADDKSIKLFVESYTISGRVSDQFYIDTGLGNNTVITVVLNTAIDVTVSMDIIGPNNVRFQKSVTATILRLEVPGTIPAGRYVFSIACLSNSTIQTDVSVKSRPVSDVHDVIRVTSRLSGTTVDFNSTNEIKLFVVVEKGGSPVLGAIVRAILAADSSVNPINVSLQDTGTGADAIANDGVYSAFLIKKFFSSQSQRYNTKVVVNGDEKAFTFDITSGSAPIPGAVPEPAYTPLQVGNFQRQSFPQEIVVSNFDPNRTATDTTPPAQITDLAVIRIVNNKATGEDSITYTLTWTAVGDDMDIGQAARYSLRTDNDIAKLRTLFNTSSVVNQSLPVPKSAGEPETLNVTLTLQDCVGTCYLALRVFDSAGLHSLTSNVVVVDVDFSYKSLAEIESKSLLQQSVSWTDNHGLVAAISVMCVLVFCVCVGICVIVQYLKLRRKRLGHHGHRLFHAELLDNKSHRLNARYRQGGRVWTSFRSEASSNNRHIAFNLTPRSNVETERSYSSANSYIFYGGPSSGYRSYGDMNGSKHPSKYMDNV